MASKTEPYGRLMQGAGTAAQHKPSNLKGPDGSPIFCAKGSAGNCATHPQLTPPPSAAKIQRVVEHQSKGGTQPANPKPKFPDTSTTAAATPTGMSATGDIKEIDAPSMGAQPIPPISTSNTW